MLQLVQLPLVLRLMPLRPEVDDATLDETQDTESQTDPKYKPYISWCVVNINLLLVSTITARVLSIWYTSCVISSSPVNWAQVPNTCRVLSPYVHVMHVSLVRHSVLYDERLARLEVSLL